MTINPDWKRILIKAWSIRLIVIASILSGIEAIIPFLGDALPIPPGLFAALSLFISASAFFARIVSQKDFRDADQ